MRILITGSGGFVGQWLIRWLREAQPDAEIVGVVHRTLPAAHSGVRWVRCDITAQHGREIHALIAAELPNHLYHLAGVASATSSDHTAVIAANVAGTAHVMSAIAQEAPLARVLFASTGYVYGNNQAGCPSRESDRLAESGVGGIYADSKRQAEPLARASGAIIARAFNHTGPGQTEDFAVPAFACQIGRIEQGLLPPQIQVGNLESIRDFLDVRDVVRAYHALMMHGVPGTAYNVCSGEGRSIRSVLEALLALSRCQIEIATDTARLRPSDISFSVGDPNKLKASAHWQPEFLFSQTLTDTLNWWRAR